MTDENSEGEAPDDEDLADEWAKALEEQDEIADEDVVSDAFEKAQLEELQDDSDDAPTIFASNPDGPDLTVILDIPVILSMEVGGTNISIRELLQLNQGSVIELDRLAGEPLDVLVNGTLIAHGEVVVVNEKFGIRFTDIVSQHERINNIN